VPTGFLFGSIALGDVTAGMALNYAVEIPPLLLVGITGFAPDLRSRRWVHFRICHTCQAVAFSREITT
jgi:hypothetical protein